MLKTPHEYNLEKIKATVPSMRWNGAEDIALWRERAQAKLLEFLGLPLVLCDDDMTVEYVKEQNGFTETRFIFQSEPGYYVPCHLCVPTGAKDPLPVVICLQGHTTGMHISLGRAKFPGEIIEGDRDFVIRAIREGYCALAIEQRCFGECGSDPNNGNPNCYESSMAALLIGRTTIGERVWDVQRAINALEKHFPQTNTKKIVCMGNSGGGTTTFFAACVEPRITYAMPSCYFCTFDDSIAAMNHCACNFIPNIRNYFDMGDMAGMIVPRPLVIVAGKDDGAFPLEGVQKAYETARKMYDAAGAPDNIKLVAGDGGHRFYADDAWPVLNKFLKENK